MILDMGLSEKWEKVGMHGKEWRRMVVSNQSLIKEGISISRSRRINFTRFVSNNLDVCVNCSPIVICSEQVFKIHRSYNRQMKIVIN